MWPERHGIEVDISRHGVWPERNGVWVEMRCYAVWPERNREGMGGYCVQGLAFVNNLGR